MGVESLQIRRIGGFAIKLGKLRRYIQNNKIKYIGAGDGSRTHLLSLGSSHSTDELRPLEVTVTNLKHFLDYG